MNIHARRVFRLALTVALSLAAGYALNLSLPFIAPIFAFMLCAPPSAPMGLKGLLGLTVLVVVTLGTGLLLVPVLDYFPVAAIMIIAIGIFFSNYIAINLNKNLVGLFLTVGITLISAAGTLDYAVSYLVINAMVIGIVVAVATQWLVYPLFPEEVTVVAPQEDAIIDTDKWIALRATIIVLPVFLLVLTNPSAYLPILMKGTALAQEASVTLARDAGRELLGSTFLGGAFAILFWFALGLNVTLWMFFLWMLIFGIYISAKVYGVLQSRMPMTFWLNVAVTMLILLGSAVGDTANGKDVYEAFAVRMGLFICVTLYAWLAIVLLERWHLGSAESTQQLAPPAAHPTA
jgi:hypothetical protein